MISGMLWNSAVFFAALLGLVTLTMRFSVRQLLLPGLAALIALSVSSLASTWHGAGPEITLAGFALRFIPAALVLGYFNPDGRAHLAGLATLWTWIWLDFIFVLRFSEQPSLSDFISSPIVFYLILPAIAGFLMGILTHLARVLKGTSSLYRRNSRNH